MKHFFLILLSSLSVTTYASPDPEAKLKALGIELHKPTPPVANYINAVRTGNLVFLAGHGPHKADGKLLFTGRVGKELTLEQGQLAAKQTAINLLSSLKAEIGDLKKVKKIVKVLGMVNAVTGFKDQPKVINGASDFFVAVFGEEVGKHARSAVGMGSLPFDIPVEIEMIVEISN